MSGTRGGDPAKTPTPRSGFAPIQKSYFWLVALGVLGIAFGGVRLLVSSAPLDWFPSLTAFACGALLVGLGAWGMRISRVVPILSTSYNLLQAGKLALASEQLDRLAGVRSRSVVGAMSVQRAMIAVRRGHLDEASAHLDRLAQTPSSWVDGPNGEIQRAVAFGIRAWVRAATDDAAGARADIAAARTGPVSGEALAQASLAEALLLQRSGERAKLAELLDRDHRLLLAGLQSRERALVRAMRRMLKAPVESVYRTRLDPKRADDAGEPPLAEWMGRVAPDLAPFVPGSGDAHAQAGQPPSDFVPSPEAVAGAASGLRPPAAAARAASGPPPPADAPRARARTPSTGKSLGGRVLLLWAFLIAIFLAVWQFLSPSPDRHGPRRAVTNAPPLEPPVVVVVWGSLALGLIVAGVGMAYIVRRARADIRKLHALAAAVLAEKDVDEDLARLATSARTESTAAQAELLRATLADQRADIARSLDHIDAARAKLKTAAGQLGAAGFLAPNLIAARAYALAALERPEEAAAELSQLPLDYFFLDRIRFVVPLVAMLVEGDVDSAGALVAATSSDLAVGPRDELLRDLVRAATSPSGVGASEIARLREELHDRDEDRRWMQRVTPALLDRFDLEQLTAARWQ